MDGCAFLRGGARRECWKPREKLGLRAVCRGGVVSTKRGYWWCSVVQCEGVDNCARCHKMGQSTFVKQRLQLLPLLSDRITDPLLLPCCETQRRVYETLLGAWISVD